MHPKMEPLIQNEVKKFLDAKIIFRVRHSEWVAKLVPVMKKLGEIIWCVDFRNLNRDSDKYNYPVPPMEQILQMVSGTELFSLLDGFLGYNQVLVSEQDRMKTTLRTKWGTFSYSRIPFGLINVGATFQREMDINFWGLISHSVVVYLDDVTVFSKKREDHVFHLKKKNRSLYKVRHIFKSQENHFHCFIRKTVRSYYL